MVAIYFLGMGIYLKLKKQLTGVSNCVYGSVGRSTQAAKAQPFLRLWSCRWIGI